MTVICSHSRLEHLTGARAKTKSSCSKKFKKATMNLKNKIKSYFYTIEIKNSRDQLQEDFGVHPPTPLLKSENNIQFELIKYQGLIGRSIIFIKDFKSEINKSRIELNEQPNLKVNQRIHNFFTFTQKSSQNNPLKMVLSFLGLLVALTLVIILAPLIIMYVVFVLLRLYLKVIRSDSQTGGYFDASSKNCNRIFINAKKKKTAADLHVHISHEHIHLLQFKSQNYNEPGLNRALFLPPEYRDDQRFLYLMDRREIEARLHESVLSYFKYAKELPTTTVGFIELLIGDDKFGEKIYLIAREIGIEIDINKLIYYQTRGSQSTSTEIALLICVMHRNNVEFAQQFLLEVLPVMYGNLLSYYGDQQTSKAFQSEILRPNAYDIYFGKA